MRSLHWVLAMAMVGGALGCSAKQEPIEATSIEQSVAEEGSLAFAVDEFNAKAQVNAVGREQPPLTADEVIAAIRSWTPEGAANDYYGQYQQIAESGWFPDNAELAFKTRLETVRGHVITVWWVDLRLTNPDGGGYTFRIRDRKIASS